MPDNTELLAAINRLIEQLGFCNRNLYKWHETLSKARKAWPMVIPLLKNPKLLKAAGPMLAELLSQIQVKIEKKPEES